MLNRKAMRVLYIDLTHRKVKVREREDLYEYLGGAGLACKLFAEEMAPEKDAFHPDQPIVFAIGPLSTIFPVVTKTVAVFRSPLTGEFGESHAGGRLAMAMRFAGYDAMVIKGRSSEPIYLDINSKQIEFKNAEPLWGMNCEETGRWLRELSTGRGHRSCVRIGPAGENGIFYANVNVDTYRHFGRLGLGACMGSKHLKGMVILGDQGIDIPDRKQYNLAYREIFKKTVETDLMKKYHELGTAVNVMTLNHIKALPTYNMRQSTFDAAEEMSGEAFAKENLVRKIACAGCPIGCIHIGLLRREFDKGYEYESVGVPYDYEPLFAMGSFLGISNREEILTLIEETELLGLDVISTGIVLGWATEALEKGLITAEQLGGKLAFGDMEGYRRAIRKIAAQENDFYRDLGKGTYYLGKKYGGFDFAMNLGRNEMPGYYTGYSYLLGVSAGARHSHLDNAGYSLDQEIVDINVDEIVDKLLKEEKKRNMLTSLCICLFARKVYDDETIVKALESIGQSWSKEELNELGEKIFLLKAKIKKALGFSYRELEYPGRFFETECVHGRLRREVIQELLDRWIEKSGVERI